MASSREERSSHGERRERRPAEFPNALAVAVARAKALTVEFAPAAALFVVLVSAWSAATSLLGIPTVILPSPVDVATTLAADLPMLLGDAAVTAATALLGLLAGVVVGLGLAFGMVSSRAVEAVVHPYVIALRVAPVVALAPLLFLWFGRGIPSRAVLVATLTVFPVTISAVGGLRSVPREYLDVGRSVAAPDWRLFLHVRVPAAAPSVFAGVKLAATISVIGAVVSEFVTLSSGLGYRVFVSSTTLRTSRAYAALVVLVCLGLVFYLGSARLERRTRTWR